MSELRAINEEWIARDELMLARNNERIRRNERWMRLFPWTRRTLREPTDQLIRACDSLRVALENLRSVTDMLPE